MGLKSSFTYPGVWRMCFYLSLAALGLVGYLNFKLAMAPCVLSLLDRGVLLSLMLLFWIGSRYVHTAASQKMFGWLGFLISVLGIIIVSRHLWLETSNSVWTYTQAVTPLEIAKEIAIGRPLGCSISYDIFGGIRDTTFSLSVFGFLAVVSFCQQFRKF